MNIIKTDINFPELLIIGVNDENTSHRISGLRYGKGNKTI